MTAADVLRRVAGSNGSPVVAAYRRTGADLPFGDSLPTHGAEMEGWFWRVTDDGLGPGGRRPLRREPPPRR